MGRGRAYNSRALTHVSVECEGGSLRSNIGLYHFGDMLWLEVMCPGDVYLVSHMLCYCKPV